MPSHILCALYAKREARTHPWCSVDKIDLFFYPRDEPIPLVVTEQFLDTLHKESDFIHGQRFSDVFNRKNLHILSVKTITATYGVLGCACPVPFYFYSPHKRWRPKSQ